MKKVVNITFFHHMSNKLSYMYQPYVSNITCSEKDLKGAFKELRKSIVYNWKEDLKGKLQSYNNYKISINISITDIEKEKTRYKQFTVNPLNLKQGN